MTINLHYHGSKFTVDPRFDDTANLNLINGQIGLIEQSGVSKSVIVRVLIDGEPHMAHFPYSDPMQWVIVTSFEREEIPAPPED